MKPIRIALTLSPLLLIVAPAPQAQAQCVAPSQVSGVWKGNDGGTYRLHRIGDVIWWVGMSADDGRSWTHVFRGTRSGNTITGEWADVRGNWGNGTLTLRISGTTFMERIGSTGSGFAATRWGRGGCNDTAGNAGGD